MEAGHAIKSVFIKEAFKQLGLLIVHGGDLWPDGYPDPLPESVYPEAFVAYLRRGGGTRLTRDWPNETRGWCERLAVALEEFPEAAKSLWAALATGMTVVANPVWVTTAQSLAAFGEEYSHRRGMTVPKVGRFEGSDNPYALLDLAPRWRELRGQLNLLRMSLMVSLAAPELPRAGQNRASVEHSKRGRPAAESPRGWTELGEAKQAILTALKAATERLKYRDLAKKAGYTPDTVRQHTGILWRWGYIDNTTDGYAITPVGAALIPC
jgi:hypothetical protein